MTRKEKDRIPITVGRFVGAIILLIVLAGWSLVAVFHTMPAGISKLTRVEPEICKSLSLTDVGTSEWDKCTEYSKDTSDGAKAAVIFGLTIDTIGVVMLVWFGPRLWKVMTAFRQQRL